MADEIIKVIDELAKRLGVAIDWTSQNVVPQIMELCEKFITYRTAFHSVGLLIGFILLFVAVKTARAMYSEYRKSFESNEHGVFFECYGSYKEPTLLCIFTSFGLAISFVAGTTILFTNMFKVIELLTFPELYIVEYFNLLGGQV